MWAPHGRGRCGRHGVPGVRFRLPAIGAIHQHGHHHPDHDQAGHHETANLPPGRARWRLWRSYLRTPLRSGTVARRMLVVGRAPSGHMRRPLSAIPESPFGSTIWVRVPTCCGHPALTSVPQEPAGAYPTRGINQATGGVGCTAGRRARARSRCSLSRYSRNGRRGRRTTRRARPGAGAAGWYACAGWYAGAGSYHRGGLHRGRRGRGGNGLWPDGPAGRFGRQGRGHGYRLDERRRLHQRGRFGDGRRGGRLDGGCGLCGGGAGTTREEGGDIAARGNNGHDRPTLGRLLGELGREGGGVVGRGADGGEFLHNRELSAVVKPRGQEGSTRACTSVSAGAPS